MLVCGKKKSLLTPGGKRCYNNTMERRFSLLLFLFGNWIVQDEPGDSSVESSSKRVEEGESRERD